MKSYSLILLLLLSLGLQAQEEIKWLTVTEVEKLNKKQPKPIIFDFYTDWCGWCKHMDKTTYTDPVVISFINRSFYAVKVNAESADTVVFRDKKYLPVKNGNRYINGLAVEMLQGKLSYPTTAFVYDKENINLVVPGYLDVLKMQAFLVYFTEDAYQGTDINRFVEDFETVFKPDAPEIKADTLHWTEFKDLEAKRKVKNKKMLLYLNASWSNSGKMMDRLVFRDSVFSELVDKYYYCMHLDVQSKDTLTFMSHKFSNAGPENSNLHQLAIALSDQVLRIPGVYIFDTDGKLMERLFFYLDRDRGRMVLDFIGSDIYKNMSWADYTRMKASEGFDTSL